MRAETQYDHYHEKSSRWFRKTFIDYTVDSDKQRDVHHHKILEKSTGRIGEGFGWSYQQAERKAWDDLVAKSRELTDRPVG